MAWSRDVTTTFPAEGAIARWEYRLFGWHCITCYRIDAACPTVTGSRSRSWWISFAEGLCFGISLPRKAT